MSGAPEEEIRMEYKIISDENSLIAERENWNSICASIPDATPFQTWEWSYYWWKSNEPAESLFVIKAFEGKQVYGYAPLVVKNETAEFIGGRDMDYGRFVVVHREIAVIEGFIDLLLEKGYGLALQEMPSKNTQLHIVQKLLEDRKRYLLHKTTRTAYVNLTQYDGLDAYMKLLSQSMRNKTIKVGLKKNLSIQKEAVTDGLLEEIKAIYENRQDVRGGAGDITWAFPVIQNLYREKLLEVYIARNEQEAVGFLVAMQHRNKQYIWLVAFKMEYKDSFPGQMLFYNVLKDGFESGNDQVDFMRGDYDFKMRWECKLDTNYTVYLCRSVWSYWKKKIWFTLRPLAKKALYSSPVLVRMYKRLGR